MHKQILGKIHTIIKDFLAYVRRYLWPLPKFRREFVVMVDGVHSHGGLTDRFRHILSIYAYCKKNDIPFRLYYVYPCDLMHFLLPNKYDWRITSSKLSYSKYDSEELTLYVSFSPHLSVEERHKINNEHHIAILDQAMAQKRHCQYHIYGNCFFAEGSYHELFHELFRLAPYLNNQILQNQKRLPPIYESVTLRFQQLLGDFHEGNFEVLSTEDSETLINKCLGKIEELYQTGYFKTKRILVTSDSSRFLECVNKKSYVCIIPGKMEHVDYTHNSDIEVNAKSFVDLFLLMKSQKLTLLQTGKMYKSGFPAFAAALGKKEFNEIVF